MAGLFLSCLNLLAKARIHEVIHVAWAALSVRDANPNFIVNSAQMDFLIKVARKEINPDGIEAEVVDSDSSNSSDSSDSSDSSSDDDDNDEKNEEAKKKRQRDNEAAAIATDSDDSDH